MAEIQEEVDKAVSNPDKTKLIRTTHKLREELLQAIKNTDIETALELNRQVNKIFQTDSMDIMKRIEGNTFRSHKNIILSHNSMYALVAEQGGLDPVLAHYMSEKYAVMIEMAKSRAELTNLHNQFMKDYASPDNRVVLDGNKSLSYKAYHFISNNFMNPIDIQFIADELYVTKEHLMRTFKRETNKTINEVIKEKRLEEGSSLLKHTNISVTDIAIMTGFNSSQYFSKVFKKTYNKTPTEYKKLINTD